MLPFCGSVFPGEEKERGGSWKDFHGPGLEVTHITFAHIPWDRIQSWGGLLAKEAGKCSFTGVPRRKENQFYHTEGTPEFEGWVYSKEPLRENPGENDV